MSSTTADASLALPELSGGPAHRQAAAARSFPAALDTPAPPRLWRTGLLAAGA